MELGIVETSASVYAEEGRILHALFADKKADRSKLTGPQREILERADNLEAQFVAEVETELNGMPLFHSFREHEFCLYRGGEAILPGTPDLARIYDDAAVIVDAKFGYAEVDVAEANYQLAAYAAMVCQEAVVPKVYVAIIQPRAPYGQRITKAVYNGKLEIESLSAAVAQIVSDAGDKDAPLCPGESQCRNCKAQLQCPAFKGDVQMLATVPRDIGAIVAQMPAEELGHLLDCIKLASSKTFGDVVKDEVKRRVESGQMPGWKLKPAGSLRQLANVREAYQRFDAAYGQHPRYTSEESTVSVADDFLGCLEPKFGEMEQLVAKLDEVGETKAKKKLNEILGDLITRADKAPSVVREKGDA